MKTLLGGLALSLVLAAPAVAADMRAPARMPVKAPPPVVATVYNWTGFYTGTGLGASWWDIEGTYLEAPPVDHHSTSATRLNYASIVGLQYQFNQVVFGVEGAFNSLFDRDYASTNSPSADCLGGNAVTDRTCHSRIGSLWTVGGRLGFAWDRFMVFGSGGYASGRVQTLTTITSTGEWTTSSSVRQNGWYAGVGMEMFVTKFWMSDVIFGVEYQHVDLGSKTHIVTPPSAPDDRNMNVTIDTVRARLIFKLTPGGPVVARY